MSTPPEPTATTARVWSGLPEFYRTADAQQQPPFPLRRYLSLITDRLDEVNALLDRIDYRSPDEGGDLGDSSDLTDPATADPRWLPWLAQFVGVVGIGSMTVLQLREAIASAGSGWRTGTMPGLIGAIRARLTPSSYGPGWVRVIRDPADVWHLIIETATGETPQGGAALLESLLGARVKPAGVRLTWQAYQLTWDVMEIVLPSWDAIEAANPWDHIETAYRL